MTGVYQQVKDLASGEVIADRVKRISDGVIIPIGAEQIDSFEYAAWIAEGNTPDPAP